MDISMMSLSDSLKAKLYYDLSTSSTNKQSLNFFVSCCLRCRIKLNTMDWISQGEPVLPLHVFTHFSDQPKCQLVPAAIGCYGNLPNQSQMETGLPWGDSDCFSKPSNSWKGGFNQACVCLPVFLCGFALNTAFLFDFCQVEEPHFSPTAKL